METQTIVSVANADSPDSANESHRVHSATILVNGHQVKMPSDEATGLQIKEAAIAQNVPIELNFILELEEHGKTRIINDNEKVHLHEGSSFTAIRNDDNS